MRRSLVTAVVATGVLVLSGCGGADTSSPSEQAPATTTSTDGSGSFDPCGQISPADMGRALGDAVSLTSGGTACSFDPTERGEPKLAVEQQSAAHYPDGFASAKDSLADLVQGGTPTDLPDVGDAAALAVGSTPGSEDVGGIGFLQVGDAVVQVGLSQGAGLSPDDVTRRLTAAMTLIAAS